MNTKKIFTTGLIISILGTNCLPVLAKGMPSKKLIKSQVSEYKIDHVNLAWWENYDDDILKGYIIKAVDNNYDLKIATLKIEEAKQQTKLQFSKELPTASIGVSPFLNKMQGVTNTEGLLSFPMIVNYEADIFLKNHDKTKSVKKLYEISKINEKAAYIAVASAVGATYFNIVKLDRLISIQNEIISSRKEIYNLMQKRNKEGITSTADVIRADKAYVMASTDLYEYKKIRSALLNKLAVLIGESPENSEELKRISYSELSSKSKIPQEISSEVITQRPDYLIAEKQVEKAGLDVRIAKKEFLPSINILGLAFFTATSASNSLNWTNALAAMGASTMLPIFTGGAKIANLKLNKNKYEQVLQNYYKTNLTAIQEVNDALSSLKLDNEKYQKNVKTLEMENADYKYTQLRYKEGIISNLDVLQRHENLLVMNKLIASSKIDCYVDEISLYKAVGGKM